ncbi:DOPA 4,5-dioxygenase family protein [Anabaena azotica]|uniref:4,5-dioxygenase n=1 Tax=Anabaena azotica FACHB-119 TaxID=947527 RepID=A0ABR8CZX4_9NOST|nr:DOPA 4,5-dioxygenase family protein [Anabaena azotica]MBD2499627.1 4,5-dioxygenase [Anabaena azotica FACHB-119]
MTAESLNITGFHAHVYFDSDSFATAMGIREQLGNKFNVQLGRVHEKPIGPHPKSMYQVAFSAAEFAQVVPWLMLNHEGLDILIHPLTGDDVSDHTSFALWLGEKLELNIDFLRQVTSNNN